MKKIFATIILLILSTNLALAKTYDFSKEPRENYYFDTFFTNEILFEKGIDFKYVGFDIGSNITFPKEYKQELDKHFYPSFSNNEAFGGVYEILEKKLGYQT